MKSCNTAERLKQIMEERNLRQIDIIEKCMPFCKELGVKMGRSDFSQYLSGKIQPKQTKLAILSRALNVSEAWLMGFDVPMERPIEQKEMDELADLVDRLKTDKRFRSLVIGLSKMNLDKIESIIKLLDIND